METSLPTGDTRLNALSQAFTSASASASKPAVDKVVEGVVEGVVKVANGWKTEKEKEGFIYVSVKGNAKERGLAHGELLADRIIKFIQTYAYYVYDHTGYTIHLFIEMMADLFMSKSSLDNKYKEIVEEIEGIAAGVVKAIQDNKVSEETKKKITPGAAASPPQPPRINLTPESFYSPPGSTPSPDKSSVAIDAKVIFLLNGIVSLFYIFPHLEKLLNSSEYSNLKEKPVYAEFLSNASYKVQTTSAPKESTFFDKLLGQGGGSDKCSAFMAVGAGHTKDGGIVYSHITFDDFMTGQFDNIILNLQTSLPASAPASAPASPPASAPASADMLMQTFPGGIFSSTDFFMTTHGFMGTETTIGGFDSFELQAPICFRARKAMQYGKTLEDYVTFLSENNSGDYACTWYIGRVKKTDTDPVDEIMRIELGRKFVNVKRTNDGYFIGFNAAYDPRIRNIECANDGFYDSRRHQGSRRIRLEEIMHQCKEDKIKIDEDMAIKIISDHKDVYLDKPDNPCSRTICAHYDEDKREYMSDPSRPKPNQPRGAVDAKVGSSKLYKQNQFLAIWGRACGAPFDPATFCKKYILWDNQKEYLEPRPARPWVSCKCILADNVADADKAIVKYTDSVYTSKKSDIFFGSETDSSSPSILAQQLSPSMQQSPSAPLQQQRQQQQQQSPSAPLQQQQQQRQLQPLSNDLKNFDGGKYNKKDMKNFMKMLKNKNKKSTKQVIKNRNTKKNKN